jgi:SOS-response transcriptional repressor LexA
LHGRKIKRSLDLRSWEAAQKRIRELEVNGEREIVAVQTAGERFISARRTKGNTEETVKKLERIMKLMTEFFGDMLSTG